ncbi:unnamed protein product, partial [Mesorhabditis belari]|uniref:Uncharacterized protein n=1 Tax=Mesorhabditis belari TaxID=2138241 RepID=A0AAF3EVW3_9BILA
MHLHPIQYRSEISALIHPFPVSNLRLNELRSIQGAIRNILAIDGSVEEKNELILAINCLAKNGDNPDVTRARQVLTKIRAELAYRQVHKACHLNMGLNRPCECLGPQQRIQHYKRLAMIQSLILTIFVIIITILSLRMFFWEKDSIMFLGEIQAQLF